MHDIAPNTTMSDRAASHGPKLHVRPQEPGAKASSSPAHPPPAHPSYKRAHAPKPPRRVQPVTDLEEGDVLIHVLGTGLGPVFCAFVCETAHHLRLRGWARCESGALTFRAEGYEPELAALVHEIRLHAPADCSIRAIEPDAGDGGAPLPECGFVPIVGEMTSQPLATGTSAAAGPDW